MLFFKYINFQEFIKVVLSLAHLYILAGPSNSCRFTKVPQLGYSVSQANCKNISQQKLKQISSELISSQKLLPSSLSLPTQIKRCPSRLHIDHRSSKNFILFTPLLLPRSTTASKTIQDISRLAIPAFISPFSKLYKIQPWLV